MTPKNKGRRVKKTEENPCTIQAGLAGGKHPPRNTCLPGLGRVLDDFAAEVEACLTHAVILADLRIDVVLVVCTGADRTLGNQRLAPSGDQNFHFGRQIKVELGRTAVHTPAPDELLGGDQRQVQAVERR